MGSSRFIYDVLSRITSADVPVVADGCTEDIDLQFQDFGGQTTLETCGTFSLTDVLLGLSVRCQGPRK